MVKKTAKKKIVKKVSKAKAGELRKSVQESKPAKLLTSDINKDVEEVKREIRKAEKWMIQRRRFFIKLGIVVGMIVILLVLSELILRQGVLG